MDRQAGKRAQRRDQQDAADADRPDQRPDGKRG
jgi:hypothetical protein